MLMNILAIGNSFSEDATRYLHGVARADGIIRSGELFARLLERGIERVHRDTFHASLGLGRYALAALWYGTLCKKSVADNSFCDLDEDVPQEQLRTAKECVDEILSQGDKSI